MLSLRWLHFINAFYLHHLIDRKKICTSPDISQTTNRCSLIFAAKNRHITGVVTVEKLIGRKARGWQWIFTFIILSFGQEGLGFSRGQDSAICTGTTDMTPVGLCKSLSTRILTVRHILLHTQELTSLKDTKPTHQTSILTTQHLIPELWNDRTLGSAQVWHLQAKAMYCN